MRPTERIAHTKGCGALLAGVAAVAFGLAGCAAVKPKPETRAEPVQEQGAPARERSVIRGLTITPEEGGTRLHLEASAAVPHRLEERGENGRVTLVLSGVVLENMAPVVEVGDGVVRSVESAALPGGDARITVRTEGPAEARVEEVADGLDLVVSLIRAGAGTEGAGPSPAPEPRVRVLEGSRGVAFRLGATPKNLAGFLLSDGKRLVVDAEGVELPEPQVIQELGSPFVRVRMGRQPGRVRAVVEAERPGLFDGYRLEKRPDGFAVLLAGSAPEEGVEARPGRPESAAGQGTHAPATQEARWAGLTGGGIVTDFGFRQDETWSRVEIQVSKPAAHRVVEVKPDRVVVDLVRTRLTQRFQRALDTSAFPGAVRLVAAYQRGEDTRVVVELRRPVPFRVERDATHVNLLFEGGTEALPEAGVAAVRKGEKEVVVVEGAAPGPPAPEGAPPEGTLEKVYTGRRLSMDFVDADIRNVLRLIGEVSGLNIVAGDDVQGKVTVRLVDVPWDQALDVILKTRGLDKVREGNVIRVAPAERLAQEAARRREREKATKEEEPLVTDLLPVNYASAEELADKVKTVLSERGSVSVDTRTNSLLVKDVAEKLEEARRLVARLDTQTPQVLIEARIVEVSSTYARDLGIQWGGRFTASTATGNATDWAFPHSISLAGDTGVGNFAVNFPSAGGAGGPGGALALTLGHVNDILTLDLRLSAIETSGHGRVISSPRVTTLDNKTAEISQGIEIPFTTATEEKIETQSIEYKLRLNVTPHVTSDGSIIMKIQVTKDAPSAAFVAVDSRTPAKETRSATTEVLVKDGETAVIGGIITDTQSNTESGIPLLSRIPVLGWLFKKKDKRVDKTELIIFITPKIVNRQAAPAAMAQNL